MVGLPGETQETLEETQRFANELNIPYGYHFFAPFPGTTAREEIENYDLTILTNNWSLYDANRPVVKTSKVDCEQMISFVAEYDRLQAALWEEMEKHCREKSCTDHEYLLVEGRRKMNLVYKVLAEDIIEETSCVLKDGINPVELLSASIADKTGTDNAFTLRVIKSFFDMGYLRHETINGSYRYYWTHNKDIEKLPISL
jgi:hypothetical protein